jgi:RimJ/RimL family protein N-acetyltransferase
MHAIEADEVASLMHEVIEALDFYVESARAAEIALYTPQYLAELGNRDSDGVLVATDDNELVGFCISYADDGPYWLAWFGTRLGFSGRRLGSALLAEMHTRRRAAGVHKIWCDSRTDNHISRACLARAGYRELCTLQNHWFHQDYVLLEHYL